MIILLTGLPGAGKTATGTALRELLVERGQEATLLDGDTFRAMAEGCTTRLDRIIDLAMKSASLDGTVICCLIAPTESDREAFRIEAGERCRIVYLDTPIEVCEARKPNTYARARSGSMGDYPGITSPYEVPASPDLTVQTEGKTPGEVAAEVQKKLLDGAGR